LKNEIHAAKPRKNPNIPALRVPMCSSGAQRRMGTWDSTNLNRTDPPAVAEPKRQLKGATRLALGTLTMRL
jgi:hypothetical protein